MASKTSVLFAAVVALVVLSASPAMSSRGLKQEQFGTVRLVATDGVETSAINLDALANFTLADIIERFTGNETNYLTILIQLFNDVATGVFGFGDFESILELLLAGDLSGLTGTLQDVFEELQLNGDILSGFEDLFGAATFNVTIPFFGNPADLLDKVIGIFDDKNTTTFLGGANLDNFLAEFGIQTGNTTSISETIQDKLDALFTGNLTAFFKAEGEFLSALPFGAETFDFLGSIFDKNATAGAVDAFFTDVATAVDDFIPGDVRVVTPVVETTQGFFGSITDWFGSLFSR